MYDPLVGSAAANSALIVLPEKIININDEKRYETIRKFTTSHIENLGEKRNIPQTFALVRFEDLTFEFFAPSATSGFSNFQTVLARL